MGKAGGEPAPKIPPTAIDNSAENTYSFIHERTAFVENQIPRGFGIRDSGFGIRKEQVHFANRVKYLRVSYARIAITQI